MKRLLQITVLIATGYLCYWISFPLVGELYLAIGEIHLKRNNNYIAMKYYLKGLSYDSTNPRLCHQLGMLYLNLSKKSSLSPRNLDMVNKGVVLLKKAVLLTGEARMDYSLGLAYELKGETEMAKFYFKRAYDRSDGRMGRNKI